jgi:hypothetical protein
MTWDVALKDIKKNSSSRSSSNSSSSSNNSNSNSNQEDASGQELVTYTGKLYTLFISYGSGLYKSIVLNDTKDYNYFTSKEDKDSDRKFRTTSKSIR